MPDQFAVISIPKSGRTWLRIMLDDAGVRATYSHDNSGFVPRLRFSDLDPDKSKYSGARVLLLVRDPRDTTASSYFQALHRMNVPVGSMSEFLKDERYGIQKVCHFNNQWFAAGDRMKRFAILSYEQMHRLPAAALAAVANFAGAYLPERNADNIASIGFLTNASSRNQG